jgi:hypothetical protein
MCRRRGVAIACLATAAVFAEVGVQAATRSSEAIRHERPIDGWSIAVSQNFRLLHFLSLEDAEALLRVAERTRAQVTRRWFGGASEDWSPRCDLAIYPSSRDYARLTGAPGEAPGHTDLRVEGGRVLRRRIHVRADHPTYRDRVVPHEVAHVVLGSEIADGLVPRWADEGLAVLAEPREAIEEHLRVLPGLRRDRRLFRLRQLLDLDDYPEPSRVSAFYAQSVSLTEFLAEERGPLVFTVFLRDAIRRGYPMALEKHYGITSIDQLQTAWEAHAFGPRPARSLASFSR